MTVFRRRLRLLPSVIALGIGLLVIKGAGLVVDARAQTTAPAPASAGAQTVNTPDPAEDDAQTASAGEVDVLTSLSKRRAELDAREQQLTMQANLIAAAEKRVDDKIAELKTLQGQMQTLLVQRDAAAQKQIDSLVKTYSSMKPKDAARIFNDLDDDVLLSVAEEMKPDVLGAILAQMESENAQKLTVKLANRLKPPATPPAQVAALTPPTPAAPMTAPAASSPAATASNATAAGTQPTQTPAAPPSATPSATAANATPPQSAPAAK